MRDAYLAKTDEELMYLVNQQEGLALEVLFNRYYQALCKFSNIYLKDYNRTEELISDLFIKLWDKGISTEIRSVKKYLFVAARNAALNEIQKVRPDVLRLEQDDQVIQLSDERLNPHELLASRESYKEIIDLINKLPERQREVLLMTRIDQLQKTHIAEILGISIRTVETLLYQSVKALRTLMNDHHFHSSI